MIDILGDSFDTFIDLILRQPLWFKIILLALLLAIIVLEIINIVWLLKGGKNE